MTSPSTLELKSINLEEAMTRLNATEEVILRLFLQMVKGFEKDITLLAPSFAPKTVSRTRALLHKMKGAAGNISAEQLRVVVEKAEQELLTQTRDLSGAEEATVPDALNDVFESVCIEFQRCAEEARSAATHRPSPQMDQGDDELAPLKKALASRSFDAIELFESMQTSLRPRFTSARWAELGQAMDEMRFADALSMVSSGDLPHRPR